MSSAAIVPLNIAALRVSHNDHDTVTGQFKGAIAQFNALGTGATTGDALMQPLESDKGPAQQLSAGIHLHWELPDHYRRGAQSAGGGKLAFPAAPNRWLVTRYVRLADPTTGAWDNVTSKTWAIESDALYPAYQPDRFGTIRPSVPVPVATIPPVMAQIVSRSPKPLTASQRASS